MAPTSLLSFAQGYTRECPAPAQLDHGRSGLAGVRRYVRNVNQAFSIGHALKRTPWRRREGTSLAAESSKSGRHTTRSRRSETLAVISHEGAKCRLAKLGCLLQHRVEYRAEVTGRGIDDLQYLGSRSLLLQRLACLGQEARILHRDDRLRGEVLHQCELLFVKRADLAAIDYDPAEELVLLAKRNPDTTARPQARQRREAMRPFPASTSASEITLSPPIMRSGIDPGGGLYGCCKLSISSPGTPRNASR